MMAFPSIYSLCGSQLASIKLMQVQLVLVVTLSLWPSLALTNSARPLGPCINKSARIPCIYHGGGLMRRKEISPIILHVSMKGTIVWLSAGSQMQHFPGKNNQLTLQLLAKLRTIILTCALNGSAESRLLTSCDFDCPDNLLTKIVFHLWTFEIAPLPNKVSYWLSCMLQKLYWHPSASTIGPTPQLTSMEKLFSFYNANGKHMRIQIDYENHKKPSTPSPYEA